MCKYNRAGQGHESHGYYHSVRPVKKKPSVPAPRAETQQGFTSMVITASLTSAFRKKQIQNQHFADIRAGKLAFTEESEEELSNSLFCFELYV